MLTFWLPPTVSRNVRDTLEPLSATRSPHGAEYVTLDGPLTNDKVILLQALQTPSVGVVVQVSLPVGHVPAGSDALLRMLDTKAPLTSSGACGLSVEYELSVTSRKLCHTVVDRWNGGSRVVQSSWEQSIRGGGRISSLVADIQSVISQYLLGERVKCW